MSLNCIVYIRYLTWSKAFRDLESKGLIHVKLVLAWHWIDMDALAADWPNAIIIDHLELEHGNFPEIFKDEIYFSELTDAYIRYYAKDMLLVDSFLDRIDLFPEKPRISSFERKYYRKKMLTFWDKVLKDFEIDVVIFFETPHSWHDYLLYVITEKYSKRFFWLHVNGFFLDLQIMSDEIGTPKKLEGRTFLTTSKKEFLRKLDDRISTIKSNYQSAIPTYMITQKEVNGISNFKFWTSRIFYIIKNFYREINTYQPIDINPKHGFGYRVTSFLDRAYSFYVMEISKERKNRKNYILNLRKRYEKLTSNVRLSDNYVFFPLHYQPERTSLPEGLFYEDQLMILNLLEKTLPENYMIYVKEHKTQFYPFMEGHQGRWKYFYETCLKSERVKLIDVDQEPFGLIDSSKAVVTITGTVGLESLIRKKKVIVFGRAWYRSFNGVLDCSEAFDAAQLIAFLEKEIDIQVVDELKEIVDVSSCLAELPEYLQISAMIESELNRPN
jgi:hypothetical protein